MRLLLFCALLLSGPPAIFAEEAVDPTPGQVHAWIEMLDAPKYGDRTEATTKLFRSGSRAIDALEATIRRGSREASDRAISILKAHYDNDDGILKEASADALQRLARQSEHPNSRAAQRILQPAESKPSITQRLIPLQIPRIPAIRPRIQRMPVFAAPINPQTIRISIVGGRRDITLEENGKSIRVSDQADGIHVEKKDQGGRIVKTKYKDLAELKKKDEEAHKVYQKGDQDPLQVQRNMPQNVIPMMPAPFGNALQLQGQRRIDELRKRIEAQRKENRRMQQKMLDEIRSRREPPKPPQRQPEATKKAGPLEV